MYLNDYDQRLPDRRDLKKSLPGGWKPWASWPTSDPRAGWAAITLNPYIKSTDIWTCPSVKASIMANVIQVAQPISADADAPITRYWLWRFDQYTDPIPLDDLWGKTPEQSLSDLQEANNPQAGFPQSTADIEMMVDPYFPAMTPTIHVELSLSGANAHQGGRNRLLLDSHVQWLRDARLDPMESGYVR
jgi:hypothetical protein